MVGRHDASGAPRHLSRQHAGCRLGGGRRNRSCLRRRSPCPSSVPSGADVRARTASRSRPGCTSTTDPRQSARARSGTRAHWPRSMTESSRDQASSSARPDPGERRSDARHQSLTTPSRARPAEQRPSPGRRGQPRSNSERAVSRLFALVTALRWSALGGVQLTIGRLRGRGLWSSVVVVRRGSGRRGRRGVGGSCRSPPTLGACR